MQKVLGLVGATLLLAGPAFAADMAVKAPALMPVFSWTGLYIGGHGGCAVTQNNHSVSFTDADPGPSFFTLNSAQGSGCYGGGQVGYNYQLAPNWVVGIEADASGASIRSSTSLNEVEGAEVEPLATFENKLTSFGTVRGRLGYTWNAASTPIMWYATGGWAWGNNRLTTTSFDTFPNGSLSSSQTHNGWAVGTGVEIALGSNWSVKGEYLYVDLGSKTYATTLITDDNARPGATTADVSVKFHTMRIGLNYKF